MQTTTINAVQHGARLRLRGGFSIITAYGLMLTLMLALRLTIGERWQVVAFINHSLHILMMPSLILLPLCLLRRRWRAALAHVPAVVTFVITYAVVFLPHSVTVPPDAVPISLLTYNLHAEQHLLDPMVDVIRTSDADIVALQEMSPEAAAQFDTDLADMYPYRALHPVSSPYHGRGILSRYPIVANRSWPEEYPIPVRLQRVELDINGTLLTLYNMHAPPSYPIFGEGYDVRPRARQIADLLHLAGQESGAVILMGDFNTTDLDENYRHITAEYRDAFREVGWGMGFTNADTSHENSREGPLPLPLYTRLDYIFHSDALIALEAHVWHTSGGSDHRPLFVRLALGVR